MSNTVITREAHVRQIIIRVKEVIREMPDAYVKQQMEEAGEQTSISTIRRFKAEGSEDAGFNYNLTVKPFARVFLGLTDTPADIAALKTDTEKDIAALNSIIEVKNDEIKRLEDELSRERDKHDRDVKHLIKESERKDTLLDERAAYLRLKDRANIALSVALAIMTAIAILALGSDAIIPLF